MPSDLVEVVFKGNRTGIYSNPVGITLKTGDYVIVEAERGEDIGIVVALGRVVSLKEMDTEPKKLMRLATDDDLNKLKTNRIEEESAFEVCKEKINKHNLNMKLVDVEYQFDKNKLTFYFTSDQRVDFRQLVRDLASKYKTRIELRQIGVRDEAKRLENIVMETYGMSLAATGGEIVDDIYGNLPNVKWERLVHEFLLT